MPGAWFSQPSGPSGSMELHSQRDTCTGALCYQGSGEQYAWIRWHFYEDTSLKDTCGKRQPPQLCRHRLMKTLWADQQSCFSRNHLGMLRYIDNCIVWCSNVGQRKIKKEINLEKCLNSVWLHSYFIDDIISIQQISGSCPTAHSRCGVGVLLHTVSAGWEIPYYTQ